MADNFNLRSFLTENKLTKNAQLLKEQEEGFKTFDDYPDGLYMGTVNGVKIYSAEDSSIFDSCAYIFEFPDGSDDFLSFDVSGQPVSSEELQRYDILKDKPEIADFISRDIANELGQEGEEQEMEEAAPSTMQAGFDMVNAEAKKHKEVIALANSIFPEFGGKLENFRPLSQEQRDQVMNTYYNSKKMKETKLTAKERRLVEMVNNAMGFSEGEENVDYTMGRQDDPNQLPNPAPELNIPEGDEMAEETVIPEYNTIDELMNSIDHGTNKVAEEHKIQEMKKIADALRMKAKKMEESEHAAHISPKDLKQLATDAAKLEKAAEKLKAAFDKKFNKKEKGAPKKEKEEKVEALQENKNKTTMEKQFDLKKFLTENRLTTNSRTVVKENSDMDEKMQFFMDFIEHYVHGMDEGSILEMLEEQYDIPEDVNMQILEKATSELDLVINDIYTAIFESENY